MQLVQRLKIFSGRHPLVGPALWILSLQYFIAQVIVASAWSIPYSWTRNTISNLGNTMCGEYGPREICSPLNPLMNASFILVGLTMLAGAGLIYHQFRRGRASAIGFSFMAAAGFGTVLVGLFPENTVSLLHFSGAMLPFLIGNIGIVILGLALEVPKWLRIYSVLSGLVSLVALVFWINHVYLGLDIGGLERIVAYPQTVWLIIFGFYASRPRP
jgi:hypothetical membrane protein